MLASFAMQPIHQCEEASIQKFHRQFSCKATNRSKLVLVSRMVHVCRMRTAVMGMHGCRSQRNIQWPNSSTQLRRMFCCEGKLLFVWSRHKVTTNQRSMPGLAPCHQCQSELRSHEHADWFRECLQCKCGLCFEAPTTLNSST